MFSVCLELEQRYPCCHGFLQSRCFCFADSIPFKFVCCLLFNYFCFNKKTPFVTVFTETWCWAQRQVSISLWTWQDNHPQRCPTPQNLNMAKVILQMGLRREHWDGEVILDDPRGSNLITWLLKTTEPFLALVREKDVARKTCSTKCNVVSFEDGGSQGRCVAAISWKRQGDQFTLRAPKRNCRHLDFSSVRLLSDFWPTEL